MLKEARRTIYNIEEVLISLLDEESYSFTIPYYGLVSFKLYQDTDDGL